MEIVKSNGDTPILPARICPIFGAQIIPATPTGAIAPAGSVGLMPVNHPCPGKTCVFWGVALDPADKSGEGLEEDGCLLVEALRQYTRKS